MDLKHMQNRIFNYNFIRRRFVNITPRWVVLSIDLMLVFVACFFSLYIVKSIIFRR